MNVEVYKKVSVPFSQKKLQTIFMSNWPYKESNVIKTSHITTVILVHNIDWGFHNFFQSVGLEPEEVGVYVTNPGYWPSPHTDGSKSGMTREWALNFPLYNCDHGYTTWHNYKTDLDIIKSDKKPGTVYNATTLDPTKVEEICRIKMDGAYMVRTDVLHSIDNRDNKHPRSVLTFRFKDTTWNQAKEIFEEYYD